MSGMSADNAPDRITRFLLKTFPGARTRGIRTDTDLLEDGILDSVGVLDVVAFIEQEFAVAVQDDDLVPENFRSVASLTEFVRRRGGGNSGPNGGR